MNIVIIIPTHNEGAIIGSLLDAVISVTNRIKHHTFTILVIDGKSTDNTQAVVKTKKVVLLVEKNKSGLGGAYIEGMNYAINTLRADAYMEFDGDYQHDPKDIFKFIEKLDEGYDYIIGSRYIPGGTIPIEWPMYRKILSFTGNLIVRIGLNISIHDTTSGFKLTRVANFKEKMPLKKGEVISLRHAYKIHFLYSIVKSEAKTIEVPIDFLNRSNGISKSTFKDIIESLRVIFIINYKNIFFKNKK